MSIGVSKPSFGSVYVSPKGLERIQNQGYRGQAKLEMIKEVAQNSEGATNDFIVNDDGNFYIRNEEYGTFTTNNPPCAEAYGKDFSVKIRRRGEDSPHTLDLKLKDEQSAQELERSFSGGTFVPAGVVALYNAMNAADAYQKEEEARISTENKTLANEILGMTKPYTEE